MSVEFGQFLLVAAGTVVVIAVGVFCFLLILPIFDAYVDSGRVERRAEKWKKRFEVKDDE